MTSTRSYCCLCLLSVPRVCFDKYCEHYGFPRRFGIRFVAEVKDLDGFGQVIFGKRDCGPFTNERQIVIRAVIESASSVCGVQGVPRIAGISSIRRRAG